VLFVRELIDREREQRQMLEAAASPPALIVVIGRRRVGKSFLLARTFTGARTVSFQGDEQSERQHLDLLAGEAGRTLLGTDALSFATWEDALRFFGGCRTNPSTRTCAALAVTAVAGAGSAEAEQSAPRPSNDLRVFRPHPQNGLSEAFGGLRDSLLAEQ
jgi:hypothetical protein